MPRALLTQSPHTSYSFSLLLLILFLFAVLGPYPALLGVGGEDLSLVLGGCCQQCSGDPLVPGTELGLPACKACTQPALYPASFELSFTSPPTAPFLGRPLSPIYTTAGVNGQVLHAPQDSAVRLCANALGMPWEKVPQCLFLRPL